MLAACLTALALMSGSASAVWVGTSGSNIPAGTMQGGNEADGTPLYLCRANFGAPGNPGVHPGKTRKEFNGCNIGWGGAERAVANYEVLVEWQATSGSNIPADAVQGGQENEGPLYICRANYQGGVHMGKTRKAFNACNIGYGGQEVAVSTYEVMVEKVGVWVATSGANIPANALQGGHEANGMPLYLCRANYGATGNLGVHPGKTRKEFNGCNIGWGGAERAVANYEVLVGWKDTSGSNIPANAVQGGQENEGPLYICRANYQGGVHMGKTRRAFNACNFGYGGKEIQGGTYQVLIKQ